MSNAIQTPFEVFYDDDGTPLEDGYIYIGTYGLNPEANPIPIFWDEALTIPASQPVRTLAGTIARNGKVSNIYSSAIDYSITVRDKKEEFIYSDLFSKRASSLTVSSVSELKALERRADGTIATVTGYYTKADGGEGQFVFDADSTATANDGTIIITDAGGAGRWLRFIDDLVSVRAFGARGDGTSNDTTPIVNAISALDGKSLYFPAGTYMTDPIDLSGITSGIRFDGDGMDVSFIKCRATVATSAVIHTNSAAINDIVITNLTVDVNRAVNSGATSLRGIWLGPQTYTTPTPDITGIRLENIHVLGSVSHNIQLSYVRKAVIDKIKSTEFSGFGIVLFRKGLESSITKSYFTPESLSTSSQAIAVDDRSTDSTVAEPCIGIIITENIIDGKDVLDTGITVEGSHGCIVSNNSIDRVDDFGITLASSNADSVPDEDADYNIVSGNYINGMNSSANNRYAIRVQGSFNKVSDNSIVNSAGNGIGVILPSDTARTSNFNIISGNTVDGTITDAIVIQQGEDNSVVDNKVNGCIRGIRIVAESAANSGGNIKRLNVAGNTIKNTSQDCIEVSTPTNNISELSLVDNDIVDWDTGAAGAIWGLKLDQSVGSLSNVNISQNDFIESSGGASLTGMRFNGTITNIRMESNRAIGTSASYSNNLTNVDGIVFEYGNSWNGRVIYGSAAPVAGTWSQGDIVYNSAPTAGGTIGWVCTTSGTAGTWKTFGNIAV